MATARRTGDGSKLAFRRWSDAPKSMATEGQLAVFSLATRQSFRCEHSRDAHQHSLAQPTLSFLAQWLYIHASAQDANTEWKSR